jgi:putative sigma-54 modulation protein
MQIDIQARGFALTEALRQHCERRLRFALGAGGGRLRGIAVRLSDVNGPKGGVDKRCTLRATLPGAPAIFIAQDETDVYTAIDRAADRAARTLLRQFKRARAERRGLPVAASAQPATDDHPS